MFSENHTTSTHTHTLPHPRLEKMYIAIKIFKGFKSPHNSQRKDQEKAHTVLFNLLQMIFFLAHMLNKLYK